MKSEDDSLETELDSNHRKFGKRDKRSKDSYDYDEDDSFNPPGWEKSVLAKKKGKK